jgi:predicted metalloprotease with PDZ domain
MMSPPAALKEEEETPMALRKMLAATLLAAALTMIGCGSSVPQATPTSTPQMGSFGLGAGSQLAPVLGVTLDFEGRVLHVEARGAAEAAGLQQGDLLQSIDGLPVQRKHLREISSAIAGTPAGELITIVLERDNVAQELKAAPRPPAGQLNQPTATVVPADQYYL